MRVREKERANRGIERANRVTFSLRFESFTQWRFFSLLIGTTLSDQSAWDSALKLNWTNSQNLIDLPRSYILKIWPLFLFANFWKYIDVRITVSNYFLVIDGRSNNIIWLNLVINFIETHKQAFVTFLLCKQMQWSNGQAAATSKRRFKM